MNNEPIGKSDFKKLKDAVEKGGGSLEMFEEYFEKLWNANKPKEREITMWVDLRGYARYQSMLYKQFKPEATDKEVSSLCIITYGMGVHWALNASKSYVGRITIVDLRTLVPLDRNTIFNEVKKLGRCLVVTEETIDNSFALALAGLISEHCFEYLDAPVKTIGSKNLPAIPLNSILEQEMILNVDKVKLSIEELLNY